ncbi:Haloacid dehalogenase-like hydrolase [Patulibacter medicamentivorans]|uniref:Haloacid dehalogenase-like hydrolase n=1 Tax=Patulibacter medicamentivorans TaxID=1097667 RepID=H0E3Y9_9ACTN|nr:haloacid dehalogenase-like hydrolase [Patulibacter medicamentivorans]EHN11604.1 Haloacid dehalogenase-like hydrolase [Patulibacter medicamentivorans]
MTVRDDSDAGAAAVGDGRWLLLWDIDGTLLLRASGSHATAVWDALCDVHGIEPATLRNGSGRGGAGKTDGQIAREILEALGVPAAAIDEQADAVRARTCERYRPEDLTAHVSPGIDGLLAELHARGDVVQSLVTGNFEPVARRKLDAAGLGRWFDPRWGGGFGSDHEQRERLPAIARARAGAALRPDGAPWPAERTVVIGDTPRDIACARHDGVAVIAVATGPHAADDLRAADAVAGDAAELRAAVAALLDGGAPIGRDGRQTIPDDPQETTA